MAHHNVYITVTCTIQEKLACLVFCSIISATIEKEEHEFYLFLADVDECLEAALMGQLACMDESMLCDNTIGSFECSCPGNTMFLDGECREPPGESAIVVCSITVEPTNKWHLRVFFFSTNDHGN